MAGSRNRLPRPASQNNSRAAWRPALLVGEILTGAVLHPVSSPARWAAVDTFQEIEGKEKTVALLQQIVDNPDEDLSQVREVIRKLYYMQTPEVIPLLQKLQKHPDGRVQFEAEDALARISPRGR